MTRNIQIDCFLTFAITIAFAGCSSSAPQSDHYRLIQSDLHIGEYVQVYDPETVVTVSRKGATTGLVAINIESEDLKVLDATASEARDIKTSRGKIAYRVGKELRFYHDKPIVIAVEIEKLRTFKWHDDYGRITADNNNKKGIWITFRLDGSIISTGLIKGSARASVSDSASELVFTQTNQGLMWHRFESSDRSYQSEGFVIEGKGHGAYVAARFIASKLYVASFDELSGTLKVAERSKSGENFNISDVDGTPSKSYRGLDIAIFDDRSHAGLIYLDGWALKPRLAIFRNNKWTSRELNFKGATGFYTQIFRESEDTISIVFHNFRSTTDGIVQSFEDLAFAVIEK